MRFGRHKGEPEKPLPVTEILTDGADNEPFMGHEGDLLAPAGLRLLTDEHDLIRPDNDGMILPGVFHFKVAGISHRRDAGRAASFVPKAQLFVLHEPTNRVDPNAIRVILGDGLHIGYVPATLCGSMLPRLLETPMGRGAPGVITRTFSTGGVVVGAEAIVAIGVELRLATKDD